MMRRGNEVSSVGVWVSTLGTYYQSLFFIRLRFVVFHTLSTWNLIGYTRLLLAGTTTFYFDYLTGLYYLMVLGLGQQI